MKKSLAMLAFAAIAVNSITAFPWSKKVEKNPSEKTEAVAENDKFYTAKTDGTLDDSKRKTLGEFSYIAPENNFKIEYEKVPGKAFNLYKNAFEKHDNSRFLDFV